jgi:integrase
MHAYITLSLLTGLRTEEARALRWVHVDLDGDPAARPPVPPHVAVWRSVRTHGDTKTERSRRSHRGVSIEDIARLAGHASTRTTEIVYRRELRPVITTGAEIMDQLFTAS